LCVSSASGRGPWLCTRGYLVRRSNLDLGTCSLVLETMSMSHDGPEFHGGLYCHVHSSFLHLPRVHMSFGVLYLPVTVTLMSVWTPLKYRSSFPSYPWRSPGGCRGGHSVSFSRVCRPLSSRVTSTYVRSVCHVERRRVAVGCQGRLRRGI
jgi:hypothetical protein